MGIWNQFLWSFWYPLKKGQRMPVLEYHLWLAWTSSQVWRMCSMELDSGIKHCAVSWDVATYQSQLLGDAGGHVPDLFMVYVISEDFGGHRHCSFSIVHQTGHIAFCGIKWYSMPFSNVYGNVCDMIHCWLYIMSLRSIVDCNSWVSDPWHSFPMVSSEKQWGLKMVIAVRSSWEIFDLRALSGAEDHM